MEKTYTVELTEKQISDLTTYIMISTRYRQGCYPALYAHHITAD